MSSLPSRIKVGYSLIKSAKWGDKGPIFRYLSGNFLNRTLGINLNQKEMTVTLDGLRVSFRTKSAQLGAYVDIFTSNVYEKLSRFVSKPGWTIVDAGANIGCYALRQAKAVGPGGRVYAFEPYPDSYALLRKNMEQNDFSWVTCFPLALSSQQGKLASLASPEETSTAQLRYHSPDGLPEVFSGQEDSLAVESTTLDTFVRTHGIHHIDILKMDTEGAEADIVRGGLQYALPVTDRVVMESHNTRYLVRDLLTPLNFELVLDYRKKHIVYFEKNVKGR